jgi:hypothetical protein
VTGARPRVSRRAAAALFLERQWLDRPRGRRLTAAALRGFAEDTGGIQLDSIHVLDRAHYLTVWNRFGEYAHATLDRLIERDRVLFEYWSHAACLVPASHGRWWRRVMADYSSRHTGWSGWIRRNPKVMREVEQAIRERGPLGNADFRQKRPGGAGWWNWKPATHALHFLWMTGRIAVHSRVHFQKRFVAAERVLPPLDGEPPELPEFLRWHARLGLHAMGAASETDLRMYLTFPRMKAGERRRTLRDLVAAGEVVEVDVEGEKAPWLALAEDLPALAAAGRRRAPSRGTALLAPFDSFLWHRERIRRLFGYDYRIEVYTPGHKRVHGYYTLPILHDGLLIGRLDAKNHRAQRRLEVRHLHFEPWFAAGSPPPAAAWGEPDRGRAVAGVAEALASLARFEGASAITVGRVTPGDLARAVRAAAASSHPGPAVPER